jgi:signal transduction histidine kinase
LLLIGMGWASWTALRLDHAHGEAQERAGFEENMRLALWRMDSTLAPLIAQESSRPYFTYNSFYPANRAYNRMFAEPPVKGEALVPSPLLTESVTNVLLHFQVQPGGGITSPQAPEPQQQSARSYVNPQQARVAAARLEQLRRMIRVDELYANCAAGTSNGLWAGVRVTTDNNLAFNGYNVPPGQMEQQQALRNNAELQSRAQTVQQAATAIGNANPFDFSGLGKGVSEGPLKPMWMGDALLLARRVVVNGESYIQGCWLDWPKIRESLLSSVKDLLPRANLVAFRESSPTADAHLLAALPLRLAATPQLTGAPYFWTPVRLSLTVAWACVLLAAAAVAILLHGTVQLSERRADFVSAVTHELRTPLTTFKMYSEMLSEGMVQDEEKKKRYLETLCAEANRLNHLVENVLAYARLERGSAKSRIEAIRIADLIERVQPRLRQRASQAGCQLAVDASEEAKSTLVHVDVSVVEQILFNLVDNACKYGTRLDHERMIHLEALSVGKGGMLRVRDHGAGISEDAARRLFQPFSKSAQEAAHSAPGVGLGLALCRRLSRAMGGELRWNPAIRDGACFELSLPVAG